MTALTKLRIRVGRNENWLEGSINVTMKSLLQHTTCLLIAILKLSGTLAIGRVPDGYFSSEESTALTLLDAIDYCDSHVACAGLTYRSNEDEDEEHDWTVYFHSFLPPLLNNTKEHDWITQRSDKAFVLHPGKLVASDHLMIDLQVDPSSLSLKDAQELCKNHSECVAFSYPINSSQLDGFDDIVFSSSLESIDTTHENWQTLVVNQANKANKTNPESMIYYDGLKEHPYSTCCEPASIDSIPSVQQVQVMDSLSRISCDISPEQFLQEYEFTRTPVMLVGCDEDWPAKTEWTLEKLSERFGNDDSTTWRSKTLDTPQDFDDLTWMEFINEMRQNRTAYIFDDLDDEAKLSIEDDYSWPKPFVDKDLYELDFPPGFGSRHWIGLGNKGSGTSPHKDPFGTDAWNSLIRGHKWWVLYPRDVVEDSTVSCDLSCSNRKWEALEWFMSIGKDAARTTFGDGVSPMHVLQKPGETIYVPEGIYHAVLNLDDTIAITANFGSPGNLQTVWEQVVRKGTEAQYIYMFDEVFTAEQRQAVMEGEIWPPQDYAGVVLDNREFFYDAEEDEDEEEYYDEDEEEEEEYYDEEDEEL